MALHHFPLCFLAALDISQDDYSSALVAVGSQDSARAQGMMSPRIAMIALVAHKIFCRDGAEEQSC